ncbi:MAG TPA: thioredoxin family protein [Candidatus Nanoarchaeia archaeon]|nr:thioredoxin family protein [Candidatus Nanoarchaeia archaeon]
MKASNFLILSVILSIVAFGCTQSVTSPDNEMMEKNIAMSKGTSMENEEIMNKEANEMAEIGFKMMNGKMMIADEKTQASSMMEKDAVLNDGTKVMMSGKVIRPNGASFMLQDGESIWMDGIFIKADDMMENEKMMKNKSMMGASYNGKVLAGTDSPYLEFNKVDYDNALKENKKILLYFYANWCPICRVEQSNTFAAFNELKDTNLVGFRVNYKDSETDADEEALAKEFGIAYQHTKVILKNGQRVGKFPDSWDKQRYLDELARI